MIPPFAIYLSSEFVCHKIYDLCEYGEDYNYSLYSTKNYSTLECFFLEFYSYIKKFSLCMFKINNCILTSCVLLQLHYTWNVNVLGKSQYIKTTRVSKVAVNVSEETRSGMQVLSIRRWKKGILAMLHI